MSAMLLHVRQCLFAIQLKSIAWGDCGMVTARTRISLPRDLYPDQLFHQRIDLFLELLNP